MAGGDGTVPLWDPATRQPAGVLAAETGPDSRVNAVAFSPDGKLPWASVNGDATIGLWILGTRHASGGFSGRNAVAFSPDGNSWPAPRRTVPCDGGTWAPAARGRSPPG